MFKKLIILCVYLILMVGCTGGLLEDSANSETQDELVEVNSGTQDELDEVTTETQDELVDENNNEVDNSSNINGFIISEQTSTNNYITSRFINIDTNGFLKKICFTVKVSQEKTQFNFYYIALKTSQYSTKQLKQYNNSNDTDEYRACFSDLSPNRSYEVVFGGSDYNVMNSDVTATISSRFTFTTPAFDRAEIPNTTITIHSKDSNSFKFDAKIEDVDQVVQSLKIKVIYTDSNIIEYEHTLEAIEDLRTDDGKLIIKDYEIDKLVPNIYYSVILYAKCDDGVEIQENIELHRQGTLTDGHSSTRNSFPRFYAIINGFQQNETSVTVDILYINEYYPQFDVYVSLKKMYTNEVVKSVFVEPGQQGITFDSLPVNSNYWVSVEVIPELSNGLLAATTITIEPYFNVPKIIEPTFTVENNEVYFSFVLSDSDNLLEDLRVEVYDKSYDNERPIITIPKEDIVIGDNKFLLDGLISGYSNYYNVYVYGTFFNGVETTENEMNSFVYSTRDLDNPRPWFTIKEQQINVEQSTMDIDVTVHNGEILDKAVLYLKESDVIVDSFEINGSGTYSLNNVIEGKIYTYEIVIDFEIYKDYVLTESYGISYGIIVE